MLCLPLLCMVVQGLIDAAGHYPLDTALDYYFKGIGITLIYLLVIFLPSKLYDKNDR